MESDLPEDLIELILLRLPVKSILNFKRVSEQWRRLITNNSFAYRLHQVQTFYNPSCSSFLLFHYLLSYHPNVIMRISLCDRDSVHSVDDLAVPVSREKNCSLVLPVGYGIYGIFENSSLRMFLWNPTTGETKLLLASSYRPSSFVHLYHFGTMDYDKDGNFSYKVGRITLQLILENGHHYGLSLELYSSKTKSWKFISNFASGEYLRFEGPIFQYANLNGKAHWMIQLDEDVTTFDYETEVFGKIKAPSPVEVGTHYDERVCIVTLFDDKFLCLLLSRPDPYSDYYLDIWVMREYGVEDSWTKEFTVGPLHWKTEVLGFSSKVGGVFLRRRHDCSDRNHMVLCDCKSSIIKLGCLLGENLFQCGMVEHVESLASLSN